MSTKPGPAQAALTERAPVLVRAAPTLAEVTREQSEFVRRLEGPGARYVVTAPGRLDVMGGITEYTGGLVLHWPVEIGVRAGGCRRDDGLLSIDVEPGGAPPFTIPLEALRQEFGSDGQASLGERCRASDGVRSHASDGAPSDDRVRIARSVAIEMLRAGMLGEGFSGASLVIGNWPSLTADLGQASAVAAAVAVALQRVAGVTIDAVQAATLVQRVEYAFNRLPCGRGDATHALLAEPGGLTQLCCDRPRGADVLRLPQRCALLGIAFEPAGVDRDAAEAERLRRYVHARVAAGIGQVLIDRIWRHESRAGRRGPGEGRMEDQGAPPGLREGEPGLRGAAPGPREGGPAPHEGGSALRGERIDPRDGRRERRHEKLGSRGRESVSRDGQLWSGHLSLICGRDYSERLRDRLPTRLAGADFLNRFGPIPDPLVAVEPQVLYRVRSRTEHHVYENARTIQFAERLARAARTGDDAVAAEAGELMYASNWSLSQRCGLNAVTADRLVTLLRRRGPASGILGAKQGGRGCGTLVIVLTAGTRAAEAAVAAACAEFESTTGLTTTLFAAPAPGAALGGVSCPQ
ncbi:MAG: hypothetical protein C4547_13805 [Phycisphaerales bacterium]|nr:MAG: hypothetical protein C4547_13805 [Phycisphaerales bacterium]